MEQAQENVRVVAFDLNGTFYNKSSKDEFYAFICKKRPKRIKYYFEMLYYKLLKQMHQMNHTEFKENFFNYLDDLTPEQVEAYATEFWQQEYPAHFNKKIKNRLDALKQEGVVTYCATGGLELYIKPLFEMYKVDGYAGTRVAYHNKTYLVQGKACKAEEKLERLEKFLEGKPYTIVEAYSDSRESILDKAEKAYLVENGELKPYQQDQA
ncbi:HAD family phosphatase [Pontibacter sp. SGAir0037]|uniref:HAD family hydrolase n=1 Tax=Pontibacter sp. SGAir0037 TaxID=2571030 RepID=UPI0010CD0637|nr:HAD family hydrolase [Pontibacter sp. SGAir0037]QCR22699.1 phosphoserine phosphatase [Pontibacter sp. SGAir0037]